MKERTAYMYILGVLVLHFLEHVPILCNKLIRSLKKNHLVNCLSFFSAGKIIPEMTWVDWEYQTRDDIGRQYRAFHHIVNMHLKGFGTFIFFRRWTRTSYTATQVVGGRLESTCLSVCPSF